MTTAEMLQSKPGVRGATIVLRSGGYFDFLNPDPGSIHPEDIAWGLAYTCRFGGQSLRYYSVAQHCVLASYAIQPPHEFEALMHDAAEAYIGDVVGPLKQLLPDYKAVEHRVEAAIAKRFRMTLPLPPEVKYVDLCLLRTEQRDLTAGSGDDWNGLDQYPLLPIVIEPWAPEMAAQMWLSRFEELEPLP
jgi:hypothetical protein